MATIITVHGTNNTGPEEGTHWWQKGSVFEQDVRTYVETEDGKLNFEPHIWDGKNSELSRHGAGERLLKRSLELEGKKEPYCYVGHSHGGSVIGHTLLKSVVKKKTNIGLLSRFITIGTPFLEMQRRRFLFLRLGTVGRALYIVTLTMALLIVIFVYGSIQLVQRRFMESIIGTSPTMLLGNILYLIAVFFPVML